MATNVIHTLRQSGGDYSLMSTWEATEQRDLVSLDETETLECYDDWAGALADRLSIRGWIADATRRITVKAAAGDSPTRFDTSSGFWISISNTNGTIPGTIETSQDHIYLEGIGVRHTATDAAVYVRNNSQAGLFCGIDSCWIMNTNTGGGRGLRNGTAAAGYIRNTSVLALGTNYTIFLVDGTSMALDNVTAISKAGGTAFSGASSSYAGTVYNCVAYTSGICFSGGYGSIPGGSNNASRDTTAPGTAAQTGVATTDFLDYANNNFAPEEAGILFANGTSPPRLPTDIFNAPRPDPDNIGAYAITGILDEISTLSIDGIKGSPQGGGGFYTSINAWEADRQQDLVTNGKTAKIDCYDDWAEGLNEFVRITGWVTGAANTITIDSPTPHNGVPGAGFILSAGGVFCIRFGNPYITVRNITCVGSGNSTNPTIYLDSQATFPTIENCILTQRGGSVWTILEVNSFSSDGVFRNILCGVDITPTLTANGFGLALLGSRHTIENCTVFSQAGNGIQQGSASSFCRNNVAYGSPTNDFFNINGTASNNASEDATAPGANPQTGVTTTDFVDFAGQDYHAAPGGKLQYGNGIDLSADFTTDIANALRNDPAGWTIGAYNEGEAPPAGVKNMNVRVGGAWASSTPYVRVGGAWVESDAYVRVGGAWVPVHEK